MRIAIVNHKGGTGKTTVCVNLAAALARSGHRVLVADADSQASASFSLGISWQDLRPSLADVLFGDFAIGQAIRHFGNSLPDLLTGDAELANSDLMLADMPDRETCLARGFEPIREQYDHVFIDCPPSLSLLSVNVLMAADAYIVPVIPEYLALEGLVSFMIAMERLKQGLGCEASLLGIVFSMTNPSSKTGKEIIRLVREQYGKNVFDTEIRRDSKLSEAPSYGTSIFGFAANSAAAKSYTRLAKEVAERTSGLKKRGK